MKKKPYRLNRNMAKKWVDALRSGIFQQETTKGQYRYFGCYCAIGVLGVACGLPFIGDNTILYKGKDIHEYLGTGLYSFVYSLNDRDKLSFPEIADKIEQNVKFI